MRCLILRCSDIAKRILVTEVPHGPQTGHHKKNTNNKSVCVVAQVATKLDHLQKNVEQFLASFHYLVLIAATIRLTFVADIFSVTALHCTPASILECSVVQCNAMQCDAMLKFLLHCAMLGRGTGQMMQQRLSTHHPTQHHLQG